MKNVYYILMSLLLTTLNILAQSDNDFRAVANGEWTDFTTGTSEIWERYDAATSSWSSATYYPGQAGNITNNVIIGNNVMITIDNPAAPNLINSITIGDESGAIDTLTIDDGSTLNTLSFIIAYDGFLTWSGNHSLNLSNASTSFVVESPNPNPGNDLGEEHGVDETPGPCNANKNIEINGTLYSSCNGGGGPSVIDFGTVNTNGGNLSVTASVDNTILCKNATIQLTATPGGIDSSDPNPSYTWIATLPNGDTESVSTVQNPTTTITEVGTHTFQVAFTNDSGIIANDVVIINAIDCKSVVTNRNITYRVTPNITSTTVTPSSSFMEITTDIQFQQYRDNNQNGVDTNELQFAYQGPDTFPDVQLLVKNVSYDTFSIISAIIQNDPIPTTSITVDTSTSAFGSGFDILITLTGINFAQNRGIKIIFNNNGVNGVCNGGSSCAGIIDFYGN